MLSLHVAVFRDAWRSIVLIHLCFDIFLHLCQNDTTLSFECEWNTQHCNFPNKAVHLHTLIFMLICKLIHRCCPTVCSQTQKQALSHCKHSLAIDAMSSTDQGPPIHMIMCGYIAMWIWDASLGGSRHCQLMSACSLTLGLGFSTNFHLVLVLFIIVSVLAL